MVKYFANLSNIGISTFLANSLSYSYFNAYDKPNVNFVLILLRQNEHLQFLSALLFLTSPNQFNGFKIYENNCVCIRVIH